MKYICTPLFRNKEGDLQVDITRIQRSPTDDMSLMESVAESPGDMVAVWDHSGDLMDRIAASLWVAMTMPDRVYTKSSLGEMILAASHYREQVEPPE